METSLWEPCLTSQAATICLGGFDLLSCLPEQVYTAEMNYVLFTVTLSQVWIRCIRLSVMTTLFVINETLSCDICLRCDFIVSPICGSVPEASIPKMWWVQILHISSRYTVCYTKSRVTHDPLFSSLFNKHNTTDTNQSDQCLSCFDSKSRREHDFTLFYSPYNV